MVNQLNLIIDKITAEIKSILIIAIIILCLYIFIKFKSARTLMIIILMIVTMITGVCSTYYVGEYYFRQGATIGSVIQSLYNGNIPKYEKKDDYTFSYKSIGFKSTGEFKQYESKVIENMEIDIDLKQNWKVYINNLICNNSTVTNNEISAQFTEKFIGKDKTLLLEDTLEINLVFNQKTLEIYITTNGGDEAVSLWNTYLEKNGFELTIKKIEKNENEIILNEEPITPVNYYEKTQGDGYAFICFDNNIMAQLLSILDLTSMYQIFLVNYYSDLNSYSVRPFFKFNSLYNGFYARTPLAGDLLKSTLLIQVISPDGELTTNILCLKFNTSDISLSKGEQINIYINHLTGYHHVFENSKYDSIKDYISKNGVWF